jgi:hypothetical protein
LLLEGKKIVIEKQAQAKTKQTKTKMFLGAVSHKGV